MVRARFLFPHISNNETLYCKRHNRFFNSIHGLAHHFWDKHLHVFYVCGNCESICGSMNDILHHLEHCKVFLTRCAHWELILCVCTNEDFFYFFNRCLLLTSKHTIVLHIFFQNSFGARFVILKKTQTRIFKATLNISSEHYFA